MKFTDSSIWIIIQNTVLPVGSINHWAAVGLTYCKGRLGQKGPFFYTFCKDTVDLENEGLQNHFA